MRILFITAFFYPHIGGVEKHTLEISKRLVKKGHEVFVITQEGLDCKINAKLDYQTNNLSDNEAGKIKEVVKSVYSASFEAGKIKVLYYNFGKQNRLKKFIIWLELLKQWKLIKSCDLVHCHDVFIWYLPLRFLFFNKPIFTTFHGYEGNMIPGKKAILMHKLAERLSWGNICVGDFLKKWYGTVPDLVTYGAVKKIKTKNKININKNQIAFVGRLEEETGILEYLKALKTLKEKRINFNLTVFGDGNLRKRSEKYCLDNNIPSKFKGFVKDIEKYLPEFEYLFTSRYLGILEGLASNKKIFSIYNNEIKKDYLVMSPMSKYIFIAGNAKEVSRQFIDQLNKKKLNKEKTWINKQTWENLTEQYINLWKI